MLRALLSAVCVLTFVFPTALLAAPPNTPAASAANGGTDNPQPERVVVLANADDPTSVELARYYIERRGVQAGNLILVSCPQQEEITWAQYIQQIHNPLLERLVRDKWIDAALAKAVDPEGRRMIAAFGHRIDFLVVMRGVPLKIKHDPDRVSRAASDAVVEQLRSNAAAVDSELALLARAPGPILGPMVNPLSGKPTPDTLSRQQIIRVARLDGLDMASVRRLIDSALEGERRGLQGRGYVDMGGPHTKGNQWLEQAGQMIQNLGFDTSWDRVPPLFSWRERFDAPALYVGWWSQNMVGPVSSPEFRFPPGAIAIHIHSFSAETMRRPNEYWTAPLVARGVAATVGNVYEPYLEFTHHPHLFIEALSRGRTVGEAAWYALPAVSWHAIFVGDPLYRPFTVDLESQLKMAQEGKGTPYTSYAVVRAMNLMRKRSPGEQTVIFGQGWLTRNPSLALLYALARQQVDASQRPQARRTLALVKGLSDLPVEELGLARLVAEFQTDLGDDDDALETFRVIFNKSKVPDEFAVAVLPDAIQAARKAQDGAQADAWAARLSRLKEGKGG